MTFWAVSEGGNTLFSPLNELIESLEPEVRKTWETLSYMSDNQIHPLIYPHPETGKDTLCFHCGAPFVRAFGVNVDLDKG